MFERVLDIHLANCLSVYFPPTFRLICSRLRIVAHHFPQSNPPAPVGPNLGRYHAKWDMKCSASAPGVLFLLSCCCVWNQKMASGLQSRCLCLLFPRLQPEHLCKELRHFRTLLNTCRKGSESRLGAVLFLFFTCACHSRSRDFISSSDLIGLLNVWLIRHLVQ